MDDDGRRARRDRNRSSVVEAMLDLFNDGNFAPSADEIAERAGLSSRSLFRYFDDLDDLVRAAIGRQLERVRPTLDLQVDVDATLPERIEALTDQRMRMFDVVGQVGHVTRIRSHYQPLIASELRALRSLLRSHIEHVFAAELERLETTVAADTIVALDVLTSFEGFHLMTDDQGLSAEEARRVVTATILQMLDPVSVAR